MSSYIWCEDSGSGLQFWNEIFKTVHPNIIVESKHNNSQLRKAAGTIVNDGNEYYILMDSFVDNADVLREIDGLKRCVSGKRNVHIMDIHSFEFALLSFESLVQWVFAEQDDLKEQRKNLLSARDLFIEQVIHVSDTDKLSEFTDLFPYAKTHNNEQIASELLYMITRNTGFETDKGNIGDCFIVSCCDWSSRQKDDICGLESARLSADEKKRQIVNGSILKAAFEKVGL